MRSKYTWDDYSRKLNETIRLLRSAQSYLSVAIVAAKFAEVDSHEAYEHLIKAAEVVPKEDK